ncbi:MAG: hypothetical protein LBU27_08615 [Candidatus Peribacteria bacterium]|nr:hypothetical protein [Candidatus Peribacteria bacterium]
MSCNVSYKCNTVSSLDLSKAAVCPWEGNNTGDVKKDDRGLRQNVATTLTGTIGRTCKDASSTKERINNPIDQNKSCTNSNSPDPDFDQSLKCQFYCPNGWHKEGEEGASQKCVENSCGKQNYTRIETPGNRSVTYDVPCLDNTQNATVSTTVTIEDGKTIYTNTFMCELGELTEEVGSCTQESTTCNPYYHTDATCSCPPNTCSTTTMTNATLCPRDNDAGTVPSHNMTSTIVNFCDSNPNKKCEFICNPYYTPDSATSCRPFICIGETPTNASVCPGDENQLTADTSRTLQGSCGNAKCEYTCNNGYENRGSTCVRVYDVVSKVTSVAHHTCQNATSCPSGYTLIAGAKYGQHCGTMNADNRWTKICYNGETSKKAEGEPCIYI